MIDHLLIHHSLISRFSLFPCLIRVLSVLSRSFPMCQILVHDTLVGSIVLFEHGEEWGVLVGRVSVHAIYADQFRAGMLLKKGN